MSTVTLSCLRCLKAMLLLVLLGLEFGAGAQTYNFRTRETSTIRTAQQIKDHNGFYDTIVVRQDKWDEMAANPGGWGNNLKFKSVHAFVKFYVNHAYPFRIYEPYTFRLAYKVYGYSNMADTVNSYTVINDTLTISYKPDSLASFQDMQYKKYSNFHKIMVVMTNLYKITGAGDPPVEMNLSATGGFQLLNFNVEGSILVQPYHKRVLSGSSYVPVYGPGAPPLDIGWESPQDDHLPIRWNLTGAATSNLELTPANYELEWTYIDNYKVNPATGAITEADGSSLAYNFRNNSTRVWLDTNYYRIPLIYQKGYLVYRVRMVRPDSTLYRYPVYGPWSLSAGSGLIGNVPAGSRYALTQAHLNDSLNWQYTVSFAEQGKYKHVMSYYDGMLKNRQSITRFNSMPGKLIATEQVYDFEGRPSISLLPTPVSTGSFRYQFNLTLNSATGYPYRAADFDTLQGSICPLDKVPSPLAAASPAYRYYSPFNDDQAGFQKFVPDAGGYPFVQTIYSPGYDERVEKQGGAGDSLQIGYNHTVKNDYVSADQMDLNRLFGTDIGWSGFYRKTVSRDPNGQLSLNVTDYKGRTVTSSLIGLPDTVSHAIVANENLADTSFYMEDHIAGTTQQVMGNKKILDKNFFNDAGGNNQAWYIYNLSPYPTFCPGKYLSVQARYDYSIFDECGTLKVDTGGVLGTTGVVTSPAAVSDTAGPVSFFMEKGRHSLHKELTINTDDVDQAVDAFMAMKPEENCLRTEPWFIRESVLSREFPCPENYVNMDCNSCAGKEYEMMQELWPNIDSAYVKRKYGIYHDATGTVIGNGNSIFTLLCGSNGNWNTVVREEDIRHVVGNGSYQGPETGGNFVLVLDPVPSSGNAFGGILIDNNNDTLHCRYRYQDECITGLPDSVTRFGQTYTDLQNLPVQTFISIFNDSIAKALLPLHPEYCDLLNCVDEDRFLKKLRSIPDASVAEPLGLLRLSQLIAADTLYQVMLGLPAQFPSPADTLARTLNGIMHLDSAALTQAYCNCLDSVMFRDCFQNIFSQQIAAGDLSDPYVKERYFSKIKNLYIANRSRYLYLLSPAGGGGSCAACQDIRMELVPPPVFTTTMDPGGGLTTGPNSLLGAVGSINPAAVGSVVAMNEYINMVDTINLDTIVVGVDSVTGDTLYNASASVYSDSSIAVYSSTLATLCNGAITQIMAQLVNCADASALAGVQNSLQALCNSGQVAVGGYTPAQIRKALTDNGIPLDDLCNPYLVNYDGLLNPPASDMEGGFSCLNDAFYESASETFNLSLAGVLQNPGASVPVSLNAGNQFEQALAYALGGNYSCNAVAAYSSLLHQYTLTLSAGGQSVKMYFRTASSGTCAQAFAQAPNETVNVRVVCANNLSGGFAGGLVGKLSFGVVVTHTGPSGTTTCNLPAWNNKVTMMSSGENRLEHCIPCTQMRDLYADFQDTLNAYKVKGVDHPLYGRMLRTFMNYRLKKAFTEDQYRDFIESCALADFRPMKKYAPYIYLNSNGVSYTNDFFAQINALDTNIMVQPAFRIKYNTGTEEIGISLDQIPFAQYRTYINFIQNYIAAHPGYFNSTEINELIYTPDKMGMVILAAGASFNPGSISYPSDPFTITYYADAELWNGVSFDPVKIYNVYTSTPNNHASVSYNAKHLAEYLFQNNIPAYYYPTVASTVNSQYTLPEKQAFLDYAYGYQGLPPNKVLDSLQEPYITPGVSLFSNRTLSYGHPAMPGNIQHLYIADPATATAGTRYYKLEHILNTVRQHFQNTAGSGTIFFTGPNTIPVMPNNGLTAYRCGDTAFWYRHFGAGDTLFNVFVRVPAYIDTSLLPGYELQDFGFNPGEEDSRSFWLRLHNPGAPIPELKLNGYTDFTIARNLRLEQVLLTHAVNQGIPRADTVLNCERQTLADAIVEGKIRYRMYIDSVRNRLRSDFYAHLMGGGITEKLYVGYRSQRFNYTLYYYDRAGNLMKTIPPAGVVTLGTGAMAAVDPSRAGNTYLPAGHLKPSVYHYNTLNQVQEQQTPDGGRTEYFYDAAGRVIFSQNEKQRSSGRMTYTLYDRQGRIMETGQAKIACEPYFQPFPSQDIPDSLSCSYYDALRGEKTPFPSVVWNLKHLEHSAVVAYVRALSREEVVYTHYDRPALNLAAAGTGLSAQEHLRNRVSCIKYFDYLQPSDSLAANYAYAMHFSYDIAGNVKTLVRDYPAWAISRQQFKRIDYDYDVISGKVNLLSYNRSFADQYFQRYSYDGDNRITKVETSSDGYIWKRDAEYQYYQHGPLARMSLGDLRVQGVDFAYTIQGWLKAVNGDMLDTARDMGGDATSNSIHARDAVALTLDYFKGDYRPIGNTAVTHLAAPARNMYNGNIPRATTAIAPFPNLNTSYAYDQLNRIIRAQYAYVNPYDGTLNPTADYYSSYAYDPDGNLKKLVRNGNALGGNSQLMDSLEYHYLPGSQHNRLQNITDYVSNNSFHHDIHHYTNAASSRYLYDATGNTIKDLVSGQDTIRWNHYNKVTHTRRDSLGNDLYFAYDGAGNRFLKSVTRTSGDTTIEQSEYYVRDAQGNILAIYRADSRSEMTRREWIEYITETLLQEVPRHTFLDAVIRPNAAQVGYFKDYVMSQATKVPAGEILANWPVSFFVQHSDAVQANIMAHSGDYSDFYQEMGAYGSSHNVPLLGAAAYAYLLQEPEAHREFLLQLLRTNVPVETRLEALGLLCDRSDSLFRQSLESAGIPYDTGGCAANLAYLEEHVLPSDEGSAQLALTIFDLASKSGGADYWPFIEALCLNNKVLAEPMYTAQGSGLLIPFFQEALSRNVNDSLLGGFMDYWAPAAGLLRSTNDENSLLQIVYDHDPTGFLENYIDQHAGGSLDIVYSGLHAIPWLNQSIYIKWWITEVTTPVVHTVYEQVLKSRRISLASHVLYGSSRLGTKDYLPDQYYMYWDYGTTPATADTGVLAARRPWYSLEYNDAISGLGLQPWGMTEQSAFLAGHQAGQKQYELTNHLGNVQATVTDLPAIPVYTQGASVSGHNPALMTAYDYYPFGMLMPGRGTDSILGQSNVQGNILVASNDFSDGTAQGWSGYNGASPPSNASGSLQANLNNYQGGVIKSFAVMSGRQYRARFSLNSSAGTKWITAISGGQIQVQYTNSATGIFHHDFTFTAGGSDAVFILEAGLYYNDPHFYVDHFILEEIKPQPETPPVVSNGCITLTQSKWVTQWVDSCYYVSKWPWPYYGPIVNGYAQVNDHAIEVVAPADEDGISFAIEVVPGVQQQLLLEASGVSGSVSVYLSEEVNGHSMSLGSMLLTDAGTEVMYFTPKQSHVKVSILGPGILFMKRVCVTRPALKQENVLVTICPEDKDRYRFGFNGQEKVNEWAGIGNYLDLGERALDTRVARLGYAVDPLAKQYPWLTPYQFAANSPIQNIDVEGLEGADANTAATVARQGVTIVGQQTAKDAGKMIVNSAGQLVEKTPLWQKALPWVGKALGTVVYVFMPVENAKPNHEFRAQLKKESDKNDKIYETYKAYRQKTGQKVNPDNEIGAERKVTLYRGVSAKHPTIAQAYVGMAVPYGGDAIPAEHNWGNWESNYTSWTIDKSVAEHHGSKEGEGGVVLTKQFKLSELTPSPDRNSEGEVLVKGVVVGATVEPAKGPGNMRTPYSTN